MKILSIFSFLLISCTVVAQSYIGESHDTLLYKHSFDLNTSAMYASSSIRNEMLNKFIFGGYIDEKMKDNSFQDHRAVNRLGAVAQGELVYTNFKVNMFRNENIGFTVTAGQFAGLSAAYSKDAFGLAFYGNQRFGDDTIDLSGSQMNSIAFTKLGFGLINKLTKSSASLNLYAISDYRKGYLFDTYISQTDNISNLSLLIDGEMRYASEKTWGQGLGAGIDLDYRLEIDWLKDKKAIIQLRGKNLGFAYLNKVNTYEIDSTYNFEGLTFNQLVGDASVFDSTFVLNDSLGARQSSGGRLIPLPAYFQAGKIVSSNYSQKWQSFFGISIFPTFSFIPRAHVGAQVTLTDYWNLGAQLSYGGFARFQAGIYSDLKAGSWRFGIGTENILGFSSAVGYGNSLNFRVQCVL